MPTRVFQPAQRAQVISPKPLREPWEKMENYFKAPAGGESLPEVNRYGEPPEKLMKIK